MDSLAVQSAVARKAFEISADRILSGSLVWKKNLPAVVSELSSVSDDGLIYVATESLYNGQPGTETHGILYCLNASSGDSIWSLDLKSHPELGFTIGYISGPPVFMQNNLYLAITIKDGEGAIVCLNRQTGSKIWSSPTTEGFNCGLNIDSNLEQGFTVANTAYLKFDLATGLIIDNIGDVSATVAWAPVVVGNFAYYFAIGGRFQARYTRGGGLAYQRIFSFGEVVGSRIYAVDTEYIYGFKTIR